MCWFVTLFIVWGRRANAQSSAKSLVQNADLKPIMKFLKEWGEYSLKNSGQTKQFIAATIVSEPEIQVSDFKIKTFIIIIIIILNTNL